MNNNIDIFFDDDKSLNPCLIDEEIIQKVIDKEKIKEISSTKKYWNYIYDFFKNNIYTIIILITILFFLIYRFYLNNRNNLELEDLNKKKNLIIDTLLKKYEDNNNVIEILRDQKNIENKQLQILNSINNINKEKKEREKDKDKERETEKKERKKKKKRIENYDDNFSNYYHI